MPVYEYQCQACHQEFEYQQRMSDPDKTTCEACGGSLERLISRTAFQLKGSGWYKDLYSSSQKPAAASGKAESGSEASGSAAASSTDKGAPSSSGTSSSAAPSSGASSSGGSASSSVAASKAT